MKNTPSPQTNHRAVFLSIICAALIIVATWMFKDTSYDEIAYVVMLPLATIATLAAFQSPHKKKGDA